MSSPSLKRGGRGEGKGKGAKADIELAEVVPAEQVLDVHETDIHHDKTQIHHATSDRDTITLVDPEPHGSSIAGASFNFINSIIGAGIIGLPFALLEAGFWLGVILIILVGFLTDYGVRMIVALGVQHGVYDYEELCEHAFGKAGKYTVAALMFIFAFGAMLAYLVIIGDTVPVVLGRWCGETTVLANRQFIVAMCSIFIILPLSSYKDMGKLSKTSFASIAAVAIMVLSVAIKGLKSGSDQNIEVDENSFSFAHANVMQSIGAIAFAFVCHHSSFIVFNSLEDATVTRWKKVSYVSITFATVACLIFSTIGYAAFLHKTEDDLLKNFAQDDDWMNVVRLLLALTMFFTYPMEFFVARHSLWSMVYPREKFMTGKQHWTITVILWLISVVLGLVLTNLGFVLELTGGVAAVSLGYILPGSLHIFLAPKETRWGKDKLLSGLLVVFGSISMVLSTAMTLKRAIEGGEPSEGDASVDVSE